MRWLDVDEDFGVYQSRLVAKYFRPKNKIDDCEGLYAATLPLEVVKVLIMQAATKCRQGEVHKVMLIDISKAHLYAPIEGEQHVDSALERAQQSCCAPSTGCGLLPASGSGSTLRPWRRRDLCHRLPRSALSSTPLRRVRIVVHGDDFVIEGGQEHLDWTKGVLANMYLVKVSSILGPERQDDKVADILNRVVEWRDDEVRWEADQRHVEKLLEDIGLVDCRLGV